MKDYALRRAALLKELDGFRYEVDRERRVGTLILDRPPLNTVSYRARAQIAALIEEFDQDDEVAVVVIRGANGVFSSGGDVKRFLDIPADGMAGLARDIAAPERCGKPVICAMEKYALGVGFEIALASDFRFATKDTVVGLPESSIGQMPGSGGSVRIARIAGLTRAKDMLLLGRRIPAEEAKAWGLLTDVVLDAEALYRLVDDTASRLASLAPLSLRTLKRVLNAAYDTSLKVAMDLEGEGYEKLRGTRDYREGIEAFTEKRRARYKGE